jgi:hypothetical protein
MGNHFAADLDEENVKLVVCSERQLKIDSSYLKVTEFRTNEHYFYCLKMPVESLWDEENRAEIREKFVNQVLIKDLKIDLNKPEYSLVHLTGNGVEIHSDLIEFITKERLIMEKVQYKKHRHIEAIWKGLSARLSASHQFLYSMKPHDITKIHEVKFSQESSPKNYISS